MAAPRQLAYADRRGDPTVRRGRRLDWRDLAAVRPGLDPPLVFPLAVPDAAQLRQNLLARQLDIRHRQVVRDRAELVEHHQVADVQALDDLVELLGDLAGG